MLLAADDFDKAFQLADGTGFTFKALCRIDTANELEYYMNGGILQYVLRSLVS